MLENPDYQVLTVSRISKWRQENTQPRGRAHSTCDLWSQSSDSPGVGTTRRVWGFFCCLLDLSGIAGQTSASLLAHTSFCLLIPVVGRWAGMHIHLCEGRHLSLWRWEDKLGCWPPLSTLLEAGSWLSSPLSVLSTPSCPQSSFPILWMDFHAVALRRPNH